MLGSGSNAENPGRQTLPVVIFSSEEIKQTTNTMNQPLVIFVSTINTKIRRVFVDQGSLTDILFRRCFDALGLTEKDLEAHSDDLVEFSGERVTSDGFVTSWVTIGNPPDTSNVKDLMHSTGLALESAIQQLGLKELFRILLSPGPNALLPVITVVNPYRKDLTPMLAGVYG
ncbi:hypothetical protein PIB30_033455 [Stylosanthes scabra]|uniref:Uncharacterized protein n=1 Tax=Stylosanthes scabra TaxID=79078 RepID=A0ABU6VFF1_9FABA|nr:hypothetical protein [Stylosanthes scabra]